MAELTIPDMSLVVLVGVSGSGKSTFARAHFAPTQVMSSDFFRGLVADDENDQSASTDAFDALGYVAGKRLAAGRITVIDATNVQQSARATWVKLAKEHNVLPVAIVLDLPQSVCVARNDERPDRDFGAHVVKRQHDDLRRSVKSLSREGFRRVHVLRGQSEVDSATIAIEPLLNDRRTETGPFDVIGDVHGCRAELEELLGTLGYAITRDADGHAAGASHPDGRRAVFVGDLVDRGPDTPGVLRLAMGMVESGDALAVCGNHEQKLVRALRGRNVRMSHGIAESLEQLSTQPQGFRARAEEFCDGLVAHYVLDGGNLVVAHAGLPEAYHGRASGRVRSFALYGDTTGETDEYGLPVRYPWANEYRGRATVLYGHTPTLDAEWINNTMCLDTGVVFGGKLTALRYPEREVVSVAAHQVWYEPVKPLVPEVVETRPDGVLTLDDVAGRRVVETRCHGRISVRPEQAAAALEVMSRFAVDPRWLPYLPPTMAPVATSSRDGVLEHPEEAFAGYLADGVRTVVCEEKHMGSRAIVLACKDSARFGIEGAGAVYTRTGRPFLTPELTEELLARVCAAVDKAGLWNELDTDWLLLDAELMPWSAKAGALIRDQYASVGAAATAALPAATRTLEAAQARGVDVADLLSRTASRAANAEAFRAAYRPYCWPVDGLDGVRIAPFQLLAAADRVYHERPHSWHLALADRLCAADPVFAPTRHLVVDTGDPESVAAGVSWWTELTAGGGEGMVVKPEANLVRGERGLVQPGVKVRGREYLRIIYGPDYTEPAHLDRLRKRDLGRKRSLALREYALGLEALERLTAGEPLWRVHECVFAVLAMESEPVDPRL
ncbi:polynucleotide 3'-phosphatase /polynucleotide 5'-hydroxyl-kinase /polynucleotide 2',3'-cyclic phosphate phosphodiesterase [Herbihabitans rhizosphaerae]|uniref:Polynucleotide 3'-phosphatase /polynucleotide 5'-hydroxyl-kinase /polynucleotide 2',3'-cyclic phosphate phosphodiesterase n=1 Tax=Herbihabitans rhizosphaerae TaxID=1872711 RepID=A0A4Q7L7R6_9PSEU|nr:polynucleotide kinase-phosphatase [Herbihabitans rhizosphaerae]RZS44412.1 polynucleotide 3'-phosphatase /polynucleotide 5'-hydroxyl-kinase /polynucleotide 2',3'-cyclic phosphate phosphodiesterase [Herbihabitans rhizosphaerae]